MLQTKELIQSLKMNGEVTAVAFNGDASRMYSFGGECSEIFLLPDKVMCFKSQSNNRKFIGKPMSKGIIMQYTLLELTLYKKWPKYFYYSTYKNTGLTGIFSHEMYNCIFFVHIHKYNFMGMYECICTCACSCKFTHARLHDCACASAYE